MKVLFSMLLLAISCVAFAQNQNPVQWKVELEKNKAGDYTIVATAAIQDGWYVYSQYLESDDGPIATAIILEEIEGQSTDFSTAAVETGDKISGYDDMFGMNITKYKKKMVIKQPIKAAKGETIRGYLTYMCCNNESCLPPTDVEFEWTVE